MCICSSFTMKWGKEKREGVIGKEEGKKEKGGRKGKGKWEWVKRR